MSTSWEQAKQDRLDAAAGLVEAGLVGVRDPAGGLPPGVSPDEVRRLVHDYYEYVPPQDVADRSAADLVQAVLDHLDFARTRAPGTALVRVLTPEDAGWSAGHTSVVEVVTEDAPFLVDTVTMELARQGRTVHLVIHPQVRVRRDLAGTLTGLDDGDGGDAGDGQRLVESWMHVEIDRLVDEATAVAIEAGLRRVLRDVQDAVQDWDRMQDQVRQIAAGWVEAPPPVPADELRQATELLDWLLAEHFTFLGFREYRLGTDDGEDVLRAVPGSGLGILRADPDLRDPRYGRLRGQVAKRARERTLLVLTKANARSTVHRPAHLDYVGVKVFDANGSIVGERRFLGLYTSAAYTESVTRIPVLRDKAAQVLATSGLGAHSHAGKALLDTLETYPRDELFHTPADELTVIARDVMYARERRQVRAFLRTDTYERYVSAVVYLPRDRYNTGVRERLARILREELGGDEVEFAVRLSEFPTARVHFVVHPPAGGTLRSFDAVEIERQLAEASRSWTEDFRSELIDLVGGPEGPRLAREWAGSFQEGYKEDYDAATGAADARRLSELAPAGDLAWALSDRPGPSRGDMRLKVYRTGDPISLSRMLPMIASLGVEVVDEWPYEFVDRPHPTWVYEFGLRHTEPVPPGAIGLVQDALGAIWDGYNEVDGFNALVLAAGLTWRQIWVLRAYARHMRQSNSPFGQVSIETAVRVNPAIARDLVELFAVRFDPERFTADEAGWAARRAAAQETVAGIEAQLDQVVSLDHDRILRAYLSRLNATLRTNHYRTHADGSPRAVLALKLAPEEIADLPEPRPRFEVFVHSPRVEGVHLRYGSVSRGGLRWSDRRDDFRTEVLGLVKAQMVKNAVIVPVGAKGGFYAKQLPDPSDRDAWLAEGRACYRQLICGLLDITDNRSQGRTVPPERVVRHDADDSYLVVAADKGTATFSDLANEVAQEYGFWLGDAFASGGSVGYDHKAMGITARGAWVSVQRHFRERGIDCQREDFTAVGIGDMSGDVFGNGMLLSPHTRLVAAFDHRDIFLDPDPDAATSHAERRRLFDLPRSSWADYDRALISPGGGVHSRLSKSIRISAQVRARLGLAEEVTSLTPAELMRAILRAPVDLLWNGGIGTYVKGVGEQHADAGDKANDAIRIDGEQIRAQCVGEGGNLGFTQRGRIEYAQRGADGVGGRINTDFIDNSAGVDTSDHEVNIKILLDRVVAEGELSEHNRNALLAEMTDEVGDLVLVDNYEQNLALANAAANAAPLLHVHEDWMKTLERRGLLNRALEALPTSKEVRARLEAGQGLTTPELSVVMAWTKIALADELLATDLPDDPFLRSELFSYFPTPMRHELRRHMEAHPLRRELIATHVVNDVVNAAGMTYWPRLEGETGAPVADLVRANTVAREIFGAAPLRAELAGLDNQIPAELQTRIRIEMRTLCERASRWLVTRQRLPLESERIVDFYGVAVQRLMGQLPDVLPGYERAGFEARRDRWIEQGASTDLATRAAVLAPAYPLLGIVETATSRQLDPLAVAAVHFGVGEELGLPGLVARIVELPRDDRWQTMARASLRDDLHQAHADLTALVLALTPEPVSAEQRVAAWTSSEGAVPERTLRTLREISEEETADLSRLSVAVGVVRALVRP